MNYRQKSPKSKAFTLLETIIALGITAVTILLISGLAQILYSPQRTTQQQDRVMWEHLITVLTMDRLQLQPCSESDSLMVFYSPPEKAYYCLLHKPDKKELIMKKALTPARPSDFKGRIPLLYHVDQIHYTYQAGILTIKATISGRQYQRRVVMAPYAES